MKQTYSLSIDGRLEHLDCEPDLLLIDLLREDLRLTGTKCGCGIGVCGSCTVLIDGSPKLACRVKAKDAAGHAIATIEGLEKGGKLHPVQQAFIDCGAIQCGFCTPGMVLTAKALLDRNPRPSRDEIKKALAGNLCRCTGYQQIFEAVEEAARRMSPGS